MLLQRRGMDADRPQDQPCFNVWREARDPRRPTRHATFLSKPPTLNPKPQARRIPLEYCPTIYRCLMRRSVGILQKQLLAMHEITRN